MRTLHNLWKVSNGWLLVPEGDQTMLHSNDACNAVVFKSLEEFSKWKPIRKRNRKPKQKETANANINQH